MLLYTSNRSDCLQASVSCGNSARQVCSSQLLRRRLLRHVRSRPRQLRRTGAYASSHANRLRRAGAGLGRRHALSHRTSSSDRSTAARADEPRGGRHARPLRTSSGRTRALAASAASASSQDKKSEVRSRSSGTRLRDLRRPLPGRPEAQRSHLRMLFPLPAQ